MTAKTAQKAGNHGRTGRSPAPEADAPDLAHFSQHMRELGVDPLEVTGDHVKLYKGALLKAEVKPTARFQRNSCALADEPR